MKKENKKVLLVCDLAGYGKVALSALIPIFSHMKCETFNLPTAIISNTFDYGKYDILDTTTYMRNTMGIWEELGFSFDAICTGFIASEEQSRLVFDYCQKQKEQRGTTIFVDPVMGDKGVLYKGIGQSTVFYMKKMCAISDLILPNATEAMFLTDFEPKRKSGCRTVFSKEEMDCIISRLREMGSKSIVITSANIEGEACTIIYEPGYAQWKALFYNEIPVEFSGTGDLFTSLVTSKRMYCVDLETAVRSAMATVEKLISLNRDNADKYKGLPIEQYLDEL